MLCETSTAAGLGPVPLVNFFLLNCFTNTLQPCASIVGHSKLVAMTSLYCNPIKLVHQSNYALFSVGLDALLVKLKPRRNLLPSEHKPQTYPFKLFLLNHLLTYPELE